MKPIFLILVALNISISPCLAKTLPKKELKLGNRLYNEEKFAEALKEYEKALSEIPDSEVVNFNVGAALYKEGDYNRAIKHFEKSLVSQEEFLEQRASYNVGNAKYKYGISQEHSNLPNAVELLKHSLRHYEHAIELDPEDEDAKYNYEFVKKELTRLEEKLKQKQSQQKQSQQQKNQDKTDRQDQQESQHDQESQQRQQDQNAAQQTTQPEHSDEGLSRKEALMLLESYQQEEEPEGLYRKKLPIQRLPQALKDW